MKQKVILVQPTKHLSETDMASMALGVAQVSELATFQDHVGGCKECQSELEVLQDLAGLVRSLPSEQSQPMGTKATLVDDQTAWETALTALQQYVVEHGHARVPDDYCTTDAYQLGRWVAQQHERFKMFEQVEKGGERRSSSPTDAVLVCVDGRYGYNQSHLLKAHGFRFDRQKHAWTKLIERSATNDYSYLKALPWAQVGASFRVSDMDGQELTEEIQVTTLELTVEEYADRKRRLNERERKKLKDDIRHKRVRIVSKTSRTNPLDDERPGVLSMEFPDWAEHLLRRRTDPQYRQWEHLLRRTRNLVERARRGRTED